jgi:ankyrin repeat protein
MALHGAITERKKDWVEFLISEGADPNLGLPTESVIEGGETNYGTIYYAILHGHLEVCKFLIEHNVQPEEDDLVLAREKGYDEIVCVFSGFSYLDVPEKEELIKRWISTHQAR